MEEEKKSPKIAKNGKRNLPKINQKNEMNV